MTSTPASSKRYVPTTAVEKPCEHCQEPIRGMPSEVAKRRFCSRECANLTRRGIRVTEWVTMNCLICDAEFQVTPAWVRSGRRKYCTKACQTVATAQQRDRRGKAHTPEARSKMGKNTPRGENSRRWKGGRFLHKGYVHVMIETLPPETRSLVQQMTTKGKYVLEHRAIATTMLGRPLTTDDVVHHLNGEKADNRPENPVVTPRADHSMEHREFERRFRALQAEVEELRAENARLQSLLH